MALMFPQDYYDDEDLYGSDESDTERRMRATHGRKLIPRDDVNDAMVRVRSYVRQPMAPPPPRTSLNSAATPYRLCLLFPRLMVFSAKVCESRI